MSRRTFWCRNCHSPCSADEVVVMTSVLTGRVTHLCKPNSVRHCWLNDAQPRDVERVSVVDHDDRGEAR